MLYVSFQDWSYACIPRNWFKFFFFFGEKKCSIQKILFTLKLKIVRLLSSAGTSRRSEQLKSDCDWLERKKLTLCGCRSQICSKDPTATWPGPNNAAYQNCIGVIRLCPTFHIAYDDWLHSEKISINTDFFVCCEFEPNVG